MSNLASITTDMIECLSDMQEYGQIEGMIAHLEEVQDILLFDQDESSDNLLKRIHMMKSNKAYIDCMKRFLVPKGGNYE